MPLCLYMASTARRRSLNLTIDLQYSVGGGEDSYILIRRRRFVVTSRNVENVKKDLGVYRKTRMGTVSPFSLVSARQKLAESVI